MKVGDRVSRKGVPWSSGTVVKLNPERKRSVNGKTFDLWVSWDQRNGATLGAMFSDVEAIRR